MPKTLTPDQINHELLGNSPFHKLFDIRVDTLDPQTAECSMPLREEHFHAGGVLHGAVTYALADTAVSLLLLGQLGLDRKVFTIEGKLNYLASVPMGTHGALSATATLVHFGKTTAVADTDIYDPDGCLLSHGIFTYAVR